MGWSWRRCWFWVWTGFGSGVGLGAWCGLCFGPPSVFSFWVRIWVLHSAAGQYSLWGRSMGLGIGVDLGVVFWSGVGVEVCAWMGLASRLSLGLGLRKEFGAALVLGLGASLCDVSSSSPLPRPQPIPTGFPFHSLKSKTPWRREFEKLNPLGQRVAAA